MLKAVLFAVAVAHVALARDNTPIDETLPAPKILEILQREFEATVHFDKNYSVEASDTAGEDNFPVARVESYLVEWAQLGHNFNISIRQNRPVGQMQVLKFNLTYEVQVFYLAKSADGKSVVKSPGSEVMWFRSHSKAVNEIRKVTDQTFFDDFNGSPGDYDERRWNVAFSSCAREETANFAINGQKHMHTQLGGLRAGCPFESLTARARGIFNFEGTSRRIFVDVDGGTFPGHQFFLEASATAEDLTDAEGLANLVRIRVDNSQIMVEQIDNNGEKTVVRGTRKNLFARGDNTYSTANVRRPWVWTVSRTQFSLTINGKNIYENVAWTTPLFSEKVHVSMTHKNVKGLRDGHDAVTMHQDNFGFEGPPQELQTHSFRNIKQRPYKAARFTRAAYNIEIDPANDISGASNARLKFTVSGTSASAGGAKNIRVNGLKVSMPRVRQLGRHQMQNIVAPFSADLLIKGRNTISIPDVDGMVGNMHIELDFSCDTNPDRSYVAPQGQGVFPNGFPISFGCNRRLLPRPTIHMDRVQNFSPVGNNKLGRTVTLDIDTGRVLRHSGGSKGIDRIEVLVNCVVVPEMTVEIGGAPFRLTDFKLDVEVEIGGMKEIWIRAIDKGGSGSLMQVKDFDADFSANVRERYKPIILDTTTGAGRIQNATQRSCSVELAFPGGECQEVASFSEGLVEQNVCLGSGAGAAAFGDENAKGSGLRANARYLLTDAWRTDTGDFGDWFEKGETETLAPEPAGCGATCSPKEGDAPDGGVKPSGHWLDRPLTVPFTTDSDAELVAWLEEEYPDPDSEGQPSSAPCVSLSLSALVMTLVAMYF